MATLNIKPIGLQNVELTFSVFESHRVREELARNFEIVVVTTKFYYFECLNNLLLRKYI